jgi:hypothetical protein
MKHQGPDLDEACVIVLPSKPPPPPPKPEPKYVAERLAICAACEHLQGKRCGILAKRNRAGLLMHPLGLPNRYAKCPDGRWGHDPPAKRSQTKIDLSAFTPTEPADPRLAIITTHFNPLGFRRLRDTYYQWLPTLGPLADVVRCYELVFDDDEPEIEGSIVIRGSRDRHWLWQKEPLINRGLRDLPASIEYVAWIDHDFVIGEPEWPTKAIDAIDAGNVAVQLFGKFNFLDQRGIVTEFRRSAMANHTQGRQAYGSPGGAWMASRSFLDAIGGLPDQNIVGGGDQTFLDLVVGKPGAHLKTYPQRMHNSLLHSIETAVAIKGNRTGSVVDVDGYHIWHGDRKNRQYLSRIDILKQHDFDPDQDVRLNADGILEWTAGSHPMHKQIQDYFAGRREDG